MNSFISASQHPRTRTVTVMKSAQRSVIYFPTNHIGNKDNMTMHLLLMQNYPAIRGTLATLNISIDLYSCLVESPGCMIFLVKSGVICNFVS